MLNKPAYFPHPSPSGHFHQQELQLQQYTLAAMSARERERERARLSPEPRLEIMRPVSPFQNKRQFAHQQAQMQAIPQTQLQRDQRMHISHYQTHSSSQPFSHAKQLRTQEASCSDMTTSSHSHARSATYQSSSRTRPIAHKGDSRGAWSQQRDMDISPALKMMAYDTSVTPPPPDQGHGRRPVNAPDFQDTLALPEREDMNRSTSPEGTRRRNPGWRKPVPKYIPTPPSTPPTAVFDERLPSTRDREELVPPVPMPSNARIALSRTTPVKAYAEPAPPPRPARAATDHQVPVMFRDLTANRDLAANLDSSHSRIPTIQQPAQAHTHHRVASAFAGSLKGVSETTPSMPKAPPSPLVQSSAVSQGQALVAPQVPPQAYTTQHVQSPPSLTATHSHSNLHPCDAKADPQRGALVHPQPRKVPSMAQLVAMVLPSRTPSPRVAPPAVEGNGPSAPSHFMAVHTQAATSVSTSQPTVPILSVDPPSPAVDTQETNNAALPRSLLQPYQIQLPPSGDSSAKSSRSVSPNPTPPKPSAPLPVRSHSRSPMPAIIPQYAPPPPPFPPPPPNTPIAAPKSNASVVLQSQINSRLAEKAEATMAATQEAQLQSVQLANAASAPRHAPSPARERALLSRDPNLMASQTTQTTEVPAEKFLTRASVQEYHPPPRGQGNVAAHVAQVANMPVNELPVSATVHEDNQPPREMQQTMAQPKHWASVSAMNSLIPVPPREHALPSREMNGSAAQVRRSKVTAMEERTTSVPVHNHVRRFQESSVANTQATQETGISEERRPTPVPTREHSQVSRESGLATPPITPPGTIASMATVKVECGRTKKEEHSDAEQLPGDVLSPTTRSHILTPYSSASASVTNVVVRCEASIQEEQLLRDDGPTVEEAKAISRPITQVFAPTFPVTTASVVPNESFTPPATKLPADWKEAITRAVLSNISPSPSPPLPSQAAHDDNSSIFCFMKPSAHAQLQAEKKESAASPEAGTWTEKLEHATSASELHVHEAEGRRVFSAIQSPDKIPVDLEKEQHVHSPRSPRRTPPALELPSTISLGVKHRVGQDFLPPTSNRNVIAEAPVRSRSPLPRRKAPQQYIDGTNFTQKADTGPAVTAATESTPISDPSSTSSVPLTRQPVELSSRGHSSGSKRKVKASRALSDNNDHDANAVRSEDDATAIRGNARYADVTALNEPIRTPAESQSSTNCISPSPRYQSLGSRKRLPLNGSDSSLVQSGDKDLTQPRPTSPPVRGRSLSPSSQTQSFSKSSRHLHGQHKRLPAPEVTQQAYRPPTPPIPSHYRKKRSNDMLPAEPPSFMKPAVHVIYPDTPDTSTSHGHSLSGDSVLNMSSYRPTNNSNRVQPTNARLYKERLSPQSPALSTPASEEQDEFETVESEAHPQVPPKGQRSDVNTHGSPSSSRKPDFTIQHATRGQVRYPSAPVGEARAHTLMLPPSSNNSRSRTTDRMERSPSSNLRARRGPQPHATKAVRSQSEKVLRNKNNVQPLARSRSTPIPSSRQRSRRSFWKVFGLWARVFMAKFKTWASPSPSPSQSREYAGYYSTDEY